MSTRSTIWRLVALALVLAMNGGLAGCTGVREDPGPGSDDAVRVSPTGSVTPGTGPLEVSGTGVGAQPFGTAAVEVMATLTARLGEPDRTVGPTRYARIHGSRGWFEDGSDPLSPSWPYEYGAIPCWDTLCLVFGGDHADSLQLRGWELATYFVPGTDPTDPQQPDVRLAGTGIRLGDSWTRLRAVYPGVQGHGGEGASLTVANTPWPAIQDGVGGWRLSGVWDWKHPTRVPHGAVVTRLSAGVGPEPGCC